MSSGRLFGGMLALMLTACGDPAIEVDLTGEPVGIDRLNFTDDTRSSWMDEGARPLATTLWYPAAQGAAMEAIAFPADRPIFIGGAAARDADMADETPRPLVFISHGTGGSALQMMWLGRELAEAGYIVAAVDHHGNTAAEGAYDPRGFRMPWHRARDVSAVLDQLLGHPEWSQRIDEDSIHAVGFSLGGYTVAALAGGRFEPDRFARFCESGERDATCDPQPEYPDAESDFKALFATDPGIADAMIEAGRTYADDRIESFVSIAPAIVQGLAPDSLADADAPFLVVVGAEDTITPADTNARALSDMVGGELRVIDGATHMSFLDQCTQRGRKYVPACEDGTRPREAVHDETVRAVLEFLETR